MGWIWNKYIKNLCLDVKNRNVKKVNEFSNIPEHMTFKKKQKKKTEGVCVLWIYPKFDIEKPKIRILSFLSKIK